MNFTTHVMFGLLIGALFFGRIDVILLIGVGSAIPDMDREYGFFSKDVFRRHQLHRALCHNFLFLGLLYLVNPFLALGAFLHTLLDAFTTAKDRGVEWLYPFSRLLTAAVYDEHGKKMELDPNAKTFMYQNDPVELTRKSADDLKMYKPRPWRRSYGPAVSGGILDMGIFIGSAALFLLLAIFSKLGVRSFINFHTLPPSSIWIPLFIGSLGIILVLSIGELKRHWEAKKPSRPAPLSYKLSYSISILIVLLGLASGAFLNPAGDEAFEANLPYLATGILVVMVVSIVVLKAYARRSDAMRKKGSPPFTV